MQFTEKHYCAIIACFMSLFEDDDDDFIIYTQSIDFNWTESVGVNAENIHKIMVEKLLEKIDGLSIIANSQDCSTFGYNGAEIKMSTETGNVSKKKLFTAITFKLLM